MWQLIIFPATHSILVIDSNNSQTVNIFCNISQNNNNGHDLGTTMYSVKDLQLLPWDCLKIWHKVGI